MFRGVGLRGIRVRGSGARQKYHEALAFSIGHICPKPVRV